MPSDLARVRRHLAVQSKVLEATLVRYYHENDERAFFEWLSRIKCVKGFDGRGTTLFITLSRKPNDNDLRELLAFFYRYKIDMRQLARFENDLNRAWFRDRRAYWYRRVFGVSASAIQQG